MKDNYAELSDGCKIEANSQEELLEQLANYRNYELMRIKEINVIIEDIERKRIKLTDNQIDAVIDAVTDESGWLVESAILDGNVMTITFDSDPD